MNYEITKYAKRTLSKILNENVSDENIYIDFKNWSISTEFNEEQEIEKVRNKLEKVNGKKAVIVNMYFDDKLYVSDVTPVIVNDTTMIPVRAVAEAFFAEVDWNDDTKEVKILSPT